MKSTFNQLNRLTTLFLISTLLLFFSSCSRKFVFMNSSVVPAAEGSVNIKKDRNKNYEVKVDIDNLAEPDKLQPPRQMYVIWMLTDQNLTKNLGHIKTSKGVFSNALNASFKTVSSFKPVKIFITAEDDPNVTNPSWDTVLSTEVFKF
jgi:hypothetical protein